MIDNVVHQIRLDKPNDISLVVFFRELVLYWRDFAAFSTKSCTIDVVATIPGSFQGGPGFIFPPFGFDT